MAMELHDTKDGLAVVLRAREGRFTPPERACGLLLHGLGTKPAAVALNGQPLESAYDSKTGVLRVSFPDTGKEQKILVQR